MQEHIALTVVSLKASEKWLFGNDNIDGIPDIAYDIDASHDDLSKKVGVWLH